MALTTSKPTDEVVAAKEATAQVDDSVVSTQAAVPDMDLGQDQSGSEAAAPAVEVKEVVTQKTNLPERSMAGGIKIVGNAVSVEAAPELQGLTIGTFSFAIVKQEKGTFKIGDADEVFGLNGKQFDMVVQTTKPRWYVKKRTKEAKESEGYYFDEEPRVDVMSSSGEVEFSEIVNKWKAEGFNYDVNKYLDVTGEVWDPQGGVGGAEGAHHLEIVTAQVSPASVDKITGRILQIIRRRGLPLSQHILRFSCPNKVGQGETAFYPWTLDYVGPAPTNV